MRCSQFGVLRSRNSAGDELAVGGKSRRIPATGNHQRRHANGGDCLALIHVPDRFAARDVSFRRSILEHALHRHHGLGGAGAELRRKPPLEHRRRDGFHSGLAHVFYPRVPDLRRADPRRRVAEHELVEALPRVHAEPHANHAPHRKPAKMNAVQPQRIEQPEDVPRELFDGVRAGRYGGLTVPARVVTQHAKLFLQRRNLRVPHREVGAERVRKDHCRRVWRAGQRVMHAQFTGFQKGHLAHSLSPAVFARWDECAARTRSIRPSATPRYWRGSNRRSSSAFVRCFATMASSASTSRRCRFSARARWQAASTISWAAIRPIPGPSAICTASAKIKPRVTSRFSTILAVSISSPGTVSAKWCNAPAASPMISGIVSHSAGQPPRPRSCCCTLAVSIALTRPGTRTAAASTTAHITGLRLCGIVEEPPRPSPAGSNASATSVCISKEMSRAIFPKVPVHSPSVVATSSTRSR